MPIGGPDDGRLAACPVIRGYVVPFDVSPTEVELVSAAIQNVGQLSEDRRTRVIDSSASVPTPPWVVLIVGGIITLGFAYMLGVERFAAQAAMVTALIMKKVGLGTVISSLAGLVFALARLVGAAGMYEARCRRCFEPGVPKQELLDFARPRVVKGALG